MDPITHAAAGAVAMLALRRRPPHCVLVGALAAASPDADIVFSGDPLNTLLLHRGITHALPAVPFFAFLLALLALPLLGRASGRPCLASSAPARWRFSTVWLCMACMLLLHIWLDCVTSYGTMIFLPFSAERIRLNGVFIIDLLLTLPLLWTVWRCRDSRRRGWREKRAALMAARLALCWIFFYPLLGVGLNALHRVQSTETLRADAARRGMVVERAVVLPDAFAPFFWRVLWRERPENSAADFSPDALLGEGMPAGGAVVRSAGLNALGRPHTPFSDPQPAMPRAAVTALAAQSVEAAAFFDFALLPVLDVLPGDDRNALLPPDVRQWRSYDLRFGSSLAFVRELMALRPHADIPFQLFFAVEAGDREALRLKSVRLRFSDSRRDSGWIPPTGPRTPSPFRALVGLR